jgi:chaperone modulatory protein CbpM
MLEAWIRAGWLRPQGASGRWHFVEIDLARADLIRDLRDDCGVNEDGVEIVLSLLDQMHGLRRTLARVLRAVHTQPPAVRQRIVEELGLGTAPDEGGAGEKGSGGD